MKITRLVLVSLLGALLVGILLLSGLACAGSDAGSKPTLTSKPSPAITSTSQPTSTHITNETGKFEIYLAINDPASYFSNFFSNFSDVEDVENVSLQEEPIVSTEDISSYNWSDHRIQLTEDGCHHVATALEEIHNHIPPFVVVANGERIYIGSFVPIFSSYWPDCPSIWYWDTEYLCNFSSGSLVIGPGFYAPNESDVRCDNRIHEALKQAGKLIE